MSAVQLNTLRTQFQLLKDDIADVGQPLFISWCNRIMNFVWRKLRASDPDRFILEETYIVDSKLQTSALPSTFSKMDVHGCGFFRLDGDGNVTDDKLAKTEPGSRLPGYYLDGSNIIFTFAENYTYVFRFLPKQPKFTLMTDYFTLDKLVTGVVIIDDEFMEYLVDAIDVKYGQWDEDVAAEGNADQRFVNVLSELLEEYERDSEAIGIATPYNNF